MYSTGDKAPNFDIKLINGISFDLHTILKNSSVLINFIRGTWCEECTNHLRRIEEWKDKLQSKKNSITTIIISVEEEGKLKTWSKENGTSYLMAADEAGTIAKTFGFMVPEDAYSKPGMILIDSSQVIRVISSDLQQSRLKVGKKLNVD